MTYRITPIKVSFVLASLLAQLPIASAAQHDHSHTANMPLVVQEPGQGAFAAIAEIVKLLGEDDTTDWRKVDIAGLRLHLVDMSELMMLSEVNVEQTDDGLRMTIDLDQPENAAAGRMVPAHAPVLAAETGWRSDVSRQGNVVTWDVTSISDFEKIKGLGFFGLMATGDHHRAHHISLARGNSMH